MPPGRPATAYQLLAGGECSSWAEVAERVGYPSPDHAYEAAGRWARRKGAEWPLLRLDLPADALARRERDAAELRDLGLGWEEVGAWLDMSAAGALRAARRWREREEIRSPKRG